MDKEKERDKLLEEMRHFTKYYKEVSSRGKQIKKFYDDEIKRIVRFSNVEKAPVEGGIK